MLDGKRSIAEKIFYGAIEKIEAYKTIMKTAERKLAANAVKLILLINSLALPIVSSTFKI
jgi:hypothetical protein